MSSESPRIFVPPPIIVIATLAAGLLIDGKLQHWEAPLLLPMLIGVGIVVAGLTLITAALGSFQKASTRPEPWQPASVLVRKGVYGFTRNPMYLGMLLIYAGVALALRSLTAAGLLVPLLVVMDRLIVSREEAYLASRFGTAFEAYRSEVRRWL